MSDRLKFRAWIIKDKKIVDVEILHPEYIKDYDGNIYLKKEFILKQCTGLRDKNGNLIYEYDVVQTDFKNRVNWRNEKHSGTIEYDEETAAFYVDSMFFDLCNFEIEVIGNIHENKDLLDE